MSRQAATCSKHLFQTCTQAATADRAAVVAMLESRGQLKWLHPPQLAAFQAVQLLRQQQHAQQQQQDLPPDLAAAEAAGSPTGPVQPPAPELQQLTADLDNTFQVIQRWSAELRAQPGASSSSSRGQAGSTAAAHGQCIGCSTRRRRLQRHAGASHSFAEAGGHDDEALTFAADHLACWDGAAARLLDDMHGCGWCGRVALGGPHSQIRRTMVARASGDMPPAVLANPMLIDLASANTNCK
ncbi:hypothetical protein COO60DRAFT_404906 [Scenedesmus sp. NREL 46B-D3]|nr:hypothetical protein COO60DRAFT_404906 [Scenedesmus sp. NREL 46B-D3]